MGQLEVVNDHDEVIGLEDYEVVHSQGLRHRSVQVLVFSEEDLRNVLVARRAQKQEVSKGLLHPSAAGHVRPGQTYQTAALAELQEELFHEHELPSGLTVVEVARYQNDTRPTNRENTALFYAVHPGPFNPDPNETAVAKFQNRHFLGDGMEADPSKYPQSFRNAMKAFRAFTREESAIDIPYILNRDEFIQTIEKYKTDHPGEPIDLEGFWKAQYYQNQLANRCTSLPKDVHTLMQSTADKLMRKLGFEYGEGAYRPTNPTKG